VKVFSSSEKAMVQSRCLGVGGSSKQVHVDFDGELLRRRDFSSKYARVQPGYCEISQISSLESLKILAGGNLKSNSGDEQVMKIKDVEFRS